MMGFLKFPYTGCLWGSAWRPFGPPELRYKVFFDDVLLRIKICSCYVSSDLSNFQDLRPRRPLTTRVPGSIRRVTQSQDKRNATGFLPTYKYMLFAGWEVRIVKNCDRGLENAARGRRPRAAFSSPKSQFFTIRTDLSR